MKRLNSFIICICLSLALCACAAPTGRGAGAGRSITAALSVRGDESILEEEQYEVLYGSTAYSLLKTALDGAGISHEYSGSVGRKTVYVIAIDGLREKSAGLDSGWKYRVNGQTPSKGGSAYILEDGDLVEWYFAKGIDE